MWHTRLVPGTPLPWWPEKGFAWYRCGRTHARAEVGECEGSSPLGKASRACRPLASDRASHSAPHTKKVVTLRHEDTQHHAYTHKGTKPCTH